jgi:DNA-binding response OmpR family regulator
VSNNRVLVIDDEVGILRFVKISLSLAGYDVITATSGEAGLKLVESAKPDIILLDILMTPMTGFEVLEKLRGFSQIPVLVFTARGDSGKRALEVGANEFIAKPFLPEQLIKKIREIIGCSQSEV